MKVTVKTMRDAFIEGLYGKMAHNDDIFFITADLGAPALDRIRHDFKDRFINVGIAEQNLVNVATGLALEGYAVYAYAIAPFLTMRAYEQIRTNLSISSQIRPVNVNLIGVGAGLSYVVSGPTHHCLEDIAIMRLLPNFVVFSPCDWTIAQHFVQYSTEVKIPKYLRFDGKALPVIYDKFDSSMMEDGFCELLKGCNICLVSTGYMTHVALAAAQKVKNTGVIDVFLLKPFNAVKLYETLKEYEYILSIEEAFLNSGGLDSLILNLLNKNRALSKLKSLGFKDNHVFNHGSRDYLHQVYGLDEEAVVSAIRKCV
ncbi:MAG: transketolase [Nitrospirae bacterium]|nr:transketolase [Nitrospirota bacterium]